MLSSVKIYIVYILLVTIAMVGCKKFVEIDPPITRVQADVVFSTNEGAISLVTGIYARMAGESPTANGIASLSVCLGLSADELAVMDEQNLTQFGMYYTNQLATLPGLGTQDFWFAFYSPYITLINTAITGLVNATTFEQNNSKSTLNEKVREQLLGEMYFMRAFCYFYLMQLYGDVPLLLTNDYVINSTTGRTAKDIVEKQIISDLQEAKNRLVGSYIDADVISVGDDKPRLRPMKAAAEAMLARVFLYKKDYVGAEQQSLSVIQNSALYGLTDLESVFLKNSREAIWQLQPVVTGRNTEEAWVFKLPATGPTATNGLYPVFLNPLLLTAFDSGDQRRTKWIDSVAVPGAGTYYYPFKYKSATFDAEVTEYSTVLRLAEQYLICAEARANLGNLTGGDSMLNAIRQRAGIKLAVSGSQEQLINAVLHERQVELFSEYGHRWLDLKRTGTVDKVMEVVTPLKGGQSWQSYQQLYPIPISEIQINKAIVQNTGY